MKPVKHWRWNEIGPRGLSILALLLSAFLLFVFWAITPFVVGWLAGHSKSVNHTLANDYAVFTALFTAFGFFTTILVIRASHKEQIEHKRQENLVFSNSLLLQGVEMFRTQLSGLKSPSGCSGLSVLAELHRKYPEMEREGNDEFIAEAQHAGIAECAAFLNSLCNRLSHWKLSAQISDAYKTDLRDILGEDAAFVFGKYRHNQCRLWLPRKWSIQDEILFYPPTIAAMLENLPQHEREHVIRGIVDKVRLSYVMTEEEIGFLLEEFVDNLAEQQTHASWLRLLDALEEKIHQNCWDVQKDILEARLFSLRGLCLQEKGFQVFEDHYDKAIETLRELSLRTDIAGDVKREIFRQLARVELELAQKIPSSDRETLLLATEAHIQESFDRSRSDEKEARKHCIYSAILREMGNKEKYLPEAEKEAALALQLHPSKNNHCNYLTCCDDVIQHATEQKKHAEAAASIEPAEKTMHALRVFLYDPKVRFARIRHGLVMTKYCIARKDFAMAEAHLGHLGKNLAAYKKIKEHSVPDFDRFDAEKTRLEDELLKCQKSEKRS